MKVAISATGRSLGAQVDPRFGRCKYLIIVNIGTMEFEAIPNVSTDSMSGAGVQMAQAIIEKGVKVVITDNIGPNAHRVLSFAGIRIISGTSGTVRNVVERFKRGQL
jgi:predicted Fe-Mo cluster-binding NifX family protein